jgi:hypothetical protein
MSSTSTSRYHVTLTNYARGLAQDVRSSLADFLAPEVVVTSASGQYKLFNDKNAFQAPSTSRAVGGPAKRLNFEADDPPYNCLPQALEIAIDDHERDEAGQGDPLRLEEAKTQTLITNAVVAHEKKVFDFASSTLTPVSGIGAWGGNSSADPVAELDALIEALATDIGQMPNRMVIGLPAWSILRHNPAVVAKFPGASQVGVTRTQFSTLLLNPEIDIRVGVLSVDQNKWGKAKSNKNIIGADIYLFYGQDKPSQYDASFMKTFRTRRGGVDAVRVYREENHRSDILAVDWTEDIKITAPICGRRVSVTSVS